MSRENRKPLAERIAGAAEAALARQKFVSPIDVFLGIGWLNSGPFASWRQGRIDCLEEAIQSKPSRIEEAMALLRGWAESRGLIASETDYVARTPQREPLRFSRAREPAVEQRYRTHWISSELSEARRERLMEKVGRAPDLVVILPLNDAWICHRCGGTGDLLIMEKPGPACLSCAGLDDLEFLPSGDALLTRRAKTKCTRSAVVVRFSKTRRRYERQGLLVERKALQGARRELAR